MSKVKMRCARCGKPFKSSDAKQTLCPDCAAKERAARAQKATAQPGMAAAKPAQPPRIVGPGATLLGATPVVAPAPAPPDRGAFGAAARAAEAEEERRARDHGRHPDHRPAPAPAAPNAHPAIHPGAHGAHDKPAARSAPAGAGEKRAPRPRAPKPPKAPPPPQELTAEQRAQVERRYLELAQPMEFDGIRTRIAAELGLPKPLVRKAVLDLRTRMALPSWWEMQGFGGSQTDLERIRAAYMPHLPVPPVGIHKRIAEQLGLEPHTVYKAIRQVRAGMRLPQFNPPDAHPEMAESRAAAPSAPTGGSAHSDV